MKKKGIVIKIDGAYLEVLEKENAPCNSENGFIEHAEHHDCSSCSGCFPLSFKKLKMIRVLNRSEKNIKVGDEISFSFKLLPLQFFIIVLLPILAFGLTFFSFYLYSYREDFCILFSFLMFLFIIGMNSLFTKKLFVPFV